MDIESGDRCEVFGGEWWRVQGGGGGGVYAFHALP